MSDTDSKKRVRRDQKGRIIEGSLNPTGRPKTPPELVEAFRDMTPKSLEVLDKAMQDYLDGHGDAGMAVRAAEVSLNRGWGKPTERVAVLQSDTPKGTYDDTEIIALFKRMAGEGDGPPYEAPVRNGESKGGGTH